jgi:glycosyltransferase involved in cell wall biosynthesis
MIERFSMRLPDRIVVENTETRTRLLDCAVKPEIVSLVPVGIDREAIDAAPPADRSVGVLFVGRLISHKNVDVLLQALSDLRAEGLVVPGVIVGDGPEREKLEQYALDLELTAQVEFLGPVESHAEVYGLMKSATAFVLPSVREGFGIVVIEALACGTPVVTMDHPDNHARLLIEDGRNGLLCVPTRAALSDAIRRVVRAETPIVPDALETLERYDWDRLLGQLIEVYVA